MRVHRGLQALGSLVSGSLRGLGLETRVKEHTCLLIWDEVVGGQVASAAQPEFVKNGCLFVVTKSPVWANELTFYKSDMIARLNERAGGEVLNDIVFKAGRLRGRERAASDARVDEPRLEEIRLTKRELEQAEAAARGAQEEASEEVRALFRTALRLEKWKKARGWKPCKCCGALQDTSSGICPPCQIEP